MAFKIGDVVSVLDEEITGTVVRATDKEVDIETDEGFVLQFRPEELIHSRKMSSNVFGENLSSQIIEQKEKSLKPKSVRKKPKDRSKPAMEVDLHIHHLTDNEGRMSNYEMLTLQLDTAKRQLEFAIRKKIQKIVFIHGVGEGVLKMELETLFRRYENIKFYEADLQKYGLGATEVYIFQNIKP